MEVVAAADSDERGLALLRAWYTLKKIFIRTCYLACTFSSSSSQSAPFVANNAEEESENNKISSSAEKFTEIKQRNMPAISQEEVSKRVSVIF